MAYTRGRCTNVDYCSLAAAKRDIEVKIGEDFVCPECTRPLRPPPVGASSGRSGLVAAGIAGAVLLAAGGFYASFRLSRPASALPQAAPAPRVASAAPAQAAVPPPVSLPRAVAAPPKQEQAMLLRLDGPALAGPLMSRLAAAYLASLGDGDLATAPSATSDETLATGMRVGRPEAVSIIAGGRRASPAGDVALGLSPVSAAAPGQPIAFSPTYVLVNARNPLTAITETQLRGVLNGSIKNWSQLGAGAGEIHLIQSADPAGDGAQELVPGTPSAPLSPNFLPASGGSAVDAASHVATEPDAISLLPWAPLPRTRALAVAALGARPALPTASAVANGLYPLVRRVTVSVPAGGKNPFAARFLAFALSPEGQQAVAQAGLVPLHVAPEAAPIQAAPATPKDRYRTLVTGATRLTADLHFEPNSNKLDLRSAREVDRVWNFMMSDHTPPDHLVLMGFADNQGTNDANLALSQQRAQAVADVFAHRGLPPGQVVAFGSDLPVADNGNEAGRERNRRVEVFLRN